MRNVAQGPHVLDGLVQTQAVMWRNLFPREEQPNDLSQPRPFQNPLRRGKGRPRQGNFVGRLEGFAAASNDATARELEAPEDVMEKGDAFVARLDEGERTVGNFRQQDRKGDPWSASTCTDVDKTCACTRAKTPLFCARDHDRVGKGELKELVQGPRRHQVHPPSPADHLIQIGLEALQDRAARERLPEAFEDPSQVIAKAVWRTVELPRTEPRVR